MSRGASATRREPWRFRSDASVLTRKRLARVLADIAAVVGGKDHGGLSLEAGRIDGPLVPGSPTGLLKSAAVFVGADTPFGPFYIGYGRAADGNQSAYLFLGRP